jgi:hypothetical protein
MHLWIEVEVWGLRSIIRMRRGKTRSCFGTLECGVQSAFEKSRLRLLKRLQVEDKRLCVSGYLGAAAFSEDSRQGLILHRSDLA